ncbi:MAG TPA: hypothetical protein VMJ93_10960 [Verrucomicrobiae bacterium]|nr:hypothetical protein [Verrucomicrobiae bacterium]
MKWALKLKNILTDHKLRSSVGVAVVLFISSIACDKLMYWRGVAAAQTYFNDVVIGLTGGICAGLILSYQASRDAMERARERMILTAELNHQLRNAVLHMTNSALLPNEMDRLRAMDDAVQQIDEVLTELVPAGGLRETSRN